MISRQYAWSDDGSIQHILNVTKEYRSSHHFKCQCCNSRMVAVVDVKKKIPHFRHYFHTCPEETYLHMAGKDIFLTLFKNNQKKNLPLSIDYTQTYKCEKKKCEYGVDFPCVRKQEIKKFSLLPRFTKIEIEKHDSQTGLIPDILLTNEKGEKCYVEIAVKHMSTEKKISSGIPLIEFYINSEEDLNALRLSSETPITNLEGLNHKFFNMNDNVVLEAPYCYDRLKKAKEEFVAFYKDFLTQKGRIYWSRGDLIEDFPEIYSEKTDSQENIYLISSNGRRIEVAFTIKLSNVDQLDNRNTIMFAVGKDGKFPWDYHHEILERDESNNLIFRKKFDIRNHAASIYFNPPRYL